MNESVTDLYQLTANSISGVPVSLSDFKGKVILFVNTASKCGFTYQYDGLQSLYEEFKDQNFVILGFPCNQFGQQEKGASGEIQEFCRLNFGVSFPMFEKIEVNGANTHPVYQYLKAEKPGVLGTKDIKWNFTKFLVDQNGQVLERFGSMTKPEKIRSKIAKLIINK